MLDRLKQQLLQRLDLPRIAQRADLAADAVGYHEAAIKQIQSGMRDCDSAFVDRLESLERWMRIERTTAWVRTAPLAHRPTISIVMPTRNRAVLLPVAIASVLDQSYPHWELVIVDDGSTDDTPAVLADLASRDTRIRVSRTEGVGAAAARNAGITTATGSWVTFLDDDNTMTAEWLRAIAEYSGRTPDCRAMFGAQLRDDVRGGDIVPWLLFDEKASLDRLRQDNTIDLGVLAVAADHPDLHFDDSLDLYIDWELVVRLFAREPLHAVPVIASTYTSTAVTRITDRHDEARLDAMRARLAD